MISGQISRTKSCPQGHEYTPENSYFYKGNKRCRRCISIRTSRGRKRKRVLRSLVNNLGEEIGKKTFDEIKERIK